MAMKLGGPRRFGAVLAMVVAACLLLGAARPAAADWGWPPGGNGFGAAHGWFGSYVTVPVPGPPVGYPFAPIPFAWAYYPRPFYHSYPSVLAAPMAVKAQNFIVFFDFDKYNLTADAQRVVDQAVAAARSSGPVRIQVTGYTDAAGTDQYNLRLSRRRADTVSAYMTAHGVPGGEIAVAGFGKQNQRVKTPDGVREAQNRRVEIVFEGPAAVARGAPYPMQPVAQQVAGTCREFKTSVSIDGKRQPMTGTACRQADGSWSIVR